MYNKKSFGETVKDIAKYIATGIVTGVVMFGSGYLTGYENAATKYAKQHENFIRNLRVVEQGVEYKPIENFEYKGHQMWIENSKEAKDNLAKIIASLDRSYMGGSFEGNSKTYVFAGAPISQIGKMNTQEVFNSQQEASDVVEAYIKGKWDNNKQYGLIQGDRVRLTDMVDNLMIYGDQKLGNGDYKLQKDELENIVSALVNLASQVGPLGDLYLNVNGDNVNLEPHFMSYNP